MSGTLTTYKLYIPERGTKRPFNAILPCPERIYVAWHRDSRGTHELLDADGLNRRGSRPNETLCEVRAYDRAMHYPGANEAFYETAALEGQR